jgi:hypothetical protein
LNDVIEEFSTRAELCNDIVVKVVLVALVVLEHIRVIYRLEHANLIEEVRLTGHRGFLEDLQCTVFVQVTMENTFNTAKTALPKRLLDPISDL